MNRKIEVTVRPEWFPDPGMTLEEIDEMVYRWYGYSEEEIVDRREMKKMERLVDGWMEEMGLS
jgi:hypothetical protein